MPSEYLFGKTALKLLRAWFLPESHLPGESHPPPSPDLKVQSSPPIRTLIVPPPFDKSLDTYPSINTAGENQYPRSFKMVTLNGEYFDISGSISAGDNKSGTEKVLKTAKAELQDLEAKMQGIKKAFDDTNIKINQD